MTTKPSASTAAAKKKLLARIAATQRLADAAKKSAKVAKLGFRTAKQKFKDAKKAAKKLRKAIKTFKAELAALSVKKKPVRKRPVAAKPAAKKTSRPAVATVPVIEPAPVAVSSETASAPVETPPVAPAN